MAEPRTVSGRTIPLIAAREVHGTRALRSGRLTRVVRGVYVATQQWSELAPWEKYAARVRAASVQHPEVVFFLESAASVQGLPVFGDPRSVHVLTGVEGRSRVSGGVRVHTTAQTRRMERVGGVLVPSLADTVVDIARARHPAVGLAVADAALRMDPSLSVELLLALNDARSSSRNRRHARWALHRATPLAESPLESVDRAVIEWLGFPPPRLQVWIGRDRVDKWWEDYRIAGEGDGDAKYGATSDEVRAAMRARHERDARLFAGGATAVPHWGWAEIIAAERLAAILGSAGLPLLTPRDHGPLASLPHALNRPKSARTQSADETAG